MYCGCLCVVSGSDMLLARIDEGCLRGRDWQLEYMSEPSLLCASAPFVWVIGAVLQDSAGIDQETVMGCSYVSCLALLGPVLTLLVHLILRNGFAQCKAGQHRMCSDNCCPYGYYPVAMIRRPTEQLTVQSPITIQRVRHPKISFETRSLSG